MNLKKRVIFISDNTTYKGGGTRYIGPYRIADELEKKGYETFVLDYYYLLQNYHDATLEALLTENVVAIGISTTFFSPPAHFDKVTQVQSRKERVTNYYDSGIISLNPNETEIWFKNLKNLLNRKSPHAKIYIGGAKASLFSEGLYQGISEVDHIVIGSADQVFHKVLEDQIIKGSPVLTSNSKKVIDTLVTYHQEKDCPNHQWHDHWFIQPNESLPIEIGRGCAFNCKFCHYDKKFNSRKSLSELKSEFIRNYEKFGTQFYQFTDDCFNDNRGKVEEICNMLLGLPFKIEWVGYARFDVAVKFPESADLMIESGARGLYWGVESLTYEVARRAGKGTHSDLIKEFMVNFYKKHGDSTYFTASFIAGLPGETRESWLEQVHWLLENPCFHFVNVGPLGLAQYKTELDMKVVDYADYSRFPEKYGFEVVNFQPFYWKHKTMDFTEAQELTDYFVTKWAELRKNDIGMAYDIWGYPNFRSLGLTPEEVRQVYLSTDPVLQSKLIEKMIESRKFRYRNYIQSFQKLTGEKTLSETSMRTV